MIKIATILSLIALGSSGAVAGAAAQAPVLQITLENHRFSPDVVNVPAGQRVRIEVTNRDATADDFDSDALHVDKDIAPHGRVAFFIGPLKAGSYPFKAELHADTAHGEVVASDAAK